jgi:hypothetical protein
LRLEQVSGPRARLRRLPVAEPIEREESPERRSASPARPPRVPAETTRVERDGASSDRPTRLVGAACLAGVAVTHAFDTAEKLDAAPYLGVMFIGLIVSSLVLAGMLLRNRRVDVAWPLAAILAANAIAGYLWSRAIGLPGIEDHIGHWQDAFGTASLVFEATLVGLGVSALRPTVMRVARGAAFVGAGLIWGGLLLGAAAGHAGHGEAGGHHEGMNIDAATPAQQADARELRASTIAVARKRFPTLAAAQAAGYRFAPRPFSKQKDLDFWHLTDPRALKDNRDLDPNRPESLMYWNSGDGPPKLMATVYRVPTRSPNPALGGPIIQWHLHKNARNGRLGRYKMTHVWHLPRLKDSFAMSMPVARFQRDPRFESLPDNGKGAGA